MKEITIEVEDVNEEGGDGYKEVVAEEGSEAEVPDEDMVGFHRTQETTEGHVHLERSIIITMKNVLQSQEDTLWETKIEDPILRWSKDIHLLKMTRDTITTRGVEGEEVKPNHLLREEVKIFFLQENQDLDHLGDLLDHVHDLHQDMIEHIVVVRQKCDLEARGLKVGAIVLVNQD